MAKHREKVSWFSEVTKYKLNDLELGYFNFIERAREKVRKSEREERERERERESEGERGGS